MMRSVHLAVAVVTLAAAFGLADREATTPMTPETPMLAASVGKTFVAMTALTLEDVGIADDSTDLVPSPETARADLATATVGFGASLSTRRPPTCLITTTCTGDPSMERKILVAYATRTGSTAEVAQAIAQRLCADGMEAAVSPISDVRDVAAYAGVVLGSAVRFATWLPEMHGFLAEHRARLAERPVAFFTMHMLALGNAPEAIAERAKYTAKARELVQPLDEVFFEGKIDPACLSLFDRLAVRLVKSPVADRRYWNRINAWADTLVPRLA